MTNEKRFINYRKTYILNIYIYYNVITHKRKTHEN